MQIDHPALATDPYPQLQANPFQKDKQGVQSQYQEHQVVRSFDTRLNNPARTDAGVESSFPESNVSKPDEASDLNPKSAMRPAQPDIDMQKNMYSPSDDAYYRDEWDTEDMIAHLDQALGASSLTETAASQGSPNDCFDPEDYDHDTSDQSKKRRPPSAQSPRRPPKAQRRGQLPTYDDDNNSNENPSTHRIDFKKLEGVSSRNKLTRTYRSSHK